MRKNSIKNTRINSEVMREISQIIRTELKDPRVSTMTSVTDVNVTTDLKYCTVYVSVLGGKEEADKTLEGLRKAGGFIRYELAHRLNLRNTPELKFVIDNSLEYGMKMDKLIDEIIGKDTKKHKEEGKEDEETL